MGFTRQSVQVYLKLPQVSRIRFNMSSFLVLSCLFAVAQASHHVVHPVHHPHPGPVVRHAAEYVSPTAHLVRTPQHDSAMVESQRYGGNFAYKTVEKPAYAEVRPIIRKEVVETGVSYSHGPAHVTKHIVPQAPVVTRSYETVHPAAVVRRHSLPPSRTRCLPPRPRRTPRTRRLRPRTCRLWRLPRSPPPLLGIQWSQCLRLSRRSLWRSIPQPRQPTRLQPRSQ